MTDRDVLQVNSQRPAAALLPRPLQSLGLEYGADPTSGPWNPADLKPEDLNLGTSSSVHYTLTHALLSGFLQQKCPAMRGFSPSSSSPSSVLPMLRPLPPQE